MTTDPTRSFLSGAEAVMWALDDVPALRSTFISVTLLDRPADVTRLRARMARAAAELPVLRRRVVTSPLDLAPPRWEDDPDFAVSRHVRRHVLPEPGTHRQLLDLAASLCAEPFDRDHPLWEFTLVEGLAGGGGALLAKMHHVLSDGVGAMRVSMTFLDFSPEGDPEPAPAPQPPQPRPVPAGWLRTVTDTVAPIVSANATELRRNLESVAAGISSLARSPADGVAAAWAGAGSVLRQVAVADPARSPLWTERAHDHRFETTSLDLDRVKAAGTALGGTVNDAFVTIVSAAAGAYHRARGSGVEELRVTVPISVRHDHHAAGNAWVPARLLVPTGDIGPAERFSLVHERLGAAKTDPSLGLADGVATTARRLPRSVLVRLAAWQVSTVDFACSNVRGSAADLWIAGAHVAATFPFGPTAGVAFNATVLSYRSSLDLGLHADTGAVDDPALLRRCIDDAASELLAAGD